MLKLTSFITSFSTYIWIKPHLTHANLHLHLANTSTDGKSDNIRAMFLTLVSETEDYSS